VTASIIAVAFAAAALVAGYLYFQERARRRSLERLDALERMPVPEREQRESDRASARQVFPPRYRSATVAMGAATTIGLWLLAALPVEVAVAAGCLIGVIGHLVEEYVADRRISAIEMQLSDAIDMVVGSLRAGAALLAAFDSALRESRTPLRPYLQDVVGRVRLGDDPREVITELAELVPLETFRLFALSLAVHWDVGGSLASTLATVGRTIRDRIELSRRVRAQGIEAHASVAAVLVIAYGLAVLMWRANPDRIDAFVRTAVGSELIAGVIALQAIGLVWMSRISRSGF